tara:strand:- start:451 stop:1014 length:564 start_codon:yes stop_codon:yes gene_type:complete
MRKYLIFLIFIFNLSCANNSGVYWCGDHPCINKKEKEAYFKKTMIVEVRNFDKKKMKNNSEIEKLLNQAKLNEKNRILTEKELKKRTREEEKELAKQIKLEEKRRIKEEKDSVKKIKDVSKKKNNENITEEKIVKLKKKKSSMDKAVIFETHIEKAEVTADNFADLVERILKRNSSRPYPEINDIPK